MKPSLTVSIFIIFLHLHFDSIKNNRRTNREERTNDKGRWKKERIKERKRKQAVLRFVCDKVEHEHSHTISHPPKKDSW